MKSRQHIQLPRPLHAKRGGKRLVSYLLMLPRECLMCPARYPRTHCPSNGNPPPRPVNQPAPPPEPTTLNRNNERMRICEKDRVSATLFTNILFLFKQIKRHTPRSILHWMMSSSAHHECPPWCKGFAGRLLRSTFLQSSSIWNGCLHCGSLFEMPGNAIQ